MPRATTSGSARVAQRVRVLAHLAAFPDVPVRQVSQDLGVAKSTLRNIKRRWGVEALLTGDVGQHSTGTDWLQFHHSTIFLFAPCPSCAGSWPGCATNTRSTVPAGLRWKW